MGYKLQSIELVVVGDNSPGNFRTDVRNTKAELWSSVKSGDRAGHPKQKITDLTVDRLRTTSPLVFYAPEGTVLNASTSYHLVFYSKLSVSSLHVRNTNTNKVDSCEATGWSIASSSHYMPGRSPASDQRWTSFDNERKMRINGTVVGKESVPTLSLALAPSSISEKGGVSTVTATLSDSAIAEVTVLVSASAVSPATSGDFTLSTNRKLTIAGGATTSTGTVTITGVDNNVDSPKKTVTVSGAANCGGVSNPANKTLTILDDETAPTVSLALTPSTISENGGVSTVTATLSGTSSAEVTVTVSASADSPATSDDFTLSTNKVLTIAAGSTASTGVVTITGVNNNVESPDKLVTVSGTTSGGAVSNPANQKLTITDDDSKGIVLSKTAVTVTEASGTGRTDDYKVKLATQPTATVTVAVASDATSAATVNKTELSFTTTNWNTEQTVTVTGVDDSIDNDPDRTATVSHSASGGGYGSVSKDLTVTVTDNESSASLSVADASVTEGNSGEADLQFTVTLSPAADREVTVDWATSKETANTATPGTDYTAGSGSLTFASGDTSKTVTVKVKGDQLNEPNETLTLTLSNASGAGISDATATGTINDDDSKGIVLSKTAVTVTEASGSGRTDDYKVKLATQPTATVTVTVSSGDTDTATVNKTELSFTTTNWNTEQTVTVTGVDDSIDNNPDRTATISHSASGGDYGLVSKDLTVTVTDNESSASLSVADANVTEGDSGEADLQFTVTLSTAAGHTVTVDWATSKETGDTATPGTDYTAGNGTLSFAAGDTSKTVTVKVTGDQLDESDETLTLTLSNASSAGISDATATGTINDDDSKGIVLTPAQVTVTEASGSGRTADYKVKLATKPTATVTVTVSSGDTDAATVNKTELSFTTSTWNMEQTVTVTGVDDSIDNNPDRSATVSHSASGGDYGLVSKDLKVTVTDNESSASLSVADANVTEGDSGEADLQFTVTLSPAAGHAVTVSWATSKETGDTATPGTDYTAGNGTLSFAAGDTSKTVTVKVTGDQLDESDETLTLTLSNASGAGISDATATGTINDDDSKGIVLTPAQVTVTEASGSGRTADYKVKLATQPTATVTVTVASDATSAATVNKASLSFTTTNWNTEQTVTVTGVDDSIDNNPDRTATISHSASGGDYGLVSKDLMVTVTDNESSASLSVADANVTEGDSGEADLQFTVTLSPAAGHAVTVSWATSKETGDTATPGTDYTAGNGTLSFAAGDTSKTVTVKVTGDQIDESDETLTLTLSNASSASITDTTATGTINDDDSKGIVLTPAQVTVTEASGTGRTADYKVKLATQPTATVTVAVASDTTSAATVNKASLSFTTTNWNTDQTVTVTGVDDSIDNDPDRTATVSHSASGGDYGLVSKDLTVTVTDNEGAASLSVADASVTEGDSGEADLQFNVTLSTATDHAVTVSWATSKETGDTATPGTDYTAGSGSLSFAAGDTSKTVKVKVTGDQIDESDETLTLTLSNASGAGIGDATATGTINDDDSKDIVLSKTAVTVTEASGSGRTDDYKVKLATQPTATVTVAVASDATSAATVNKTSLSFTTTNWNTEQTVTVTGVDDSIDNDPDRTATVSHRASGGDYGSMSKDLTVTVTDNEGAASLSVADTNVIEGDSGEADLQFTVTLSPAAGHAVTISWATSKETGDTATPGTDYTAGNGTLSFAAGDTSKTVTVKVTGDQIDESDETLTLTLSNASGADIGDATATGTINDDDTKDIELTTEQVTVTEASGSGRTADYKVKLATQPTATVTVAVASDTTSAATVNKTSLSFTTTNWNTEQTVTVTGVDDSIDNDPDRTATVRHRASGGDYASVSKDLTVTVTDDEGAASLSVADASVTEGDSGEADLQFTVTLSTAAGNAVTVSWATSKETGDTATPGTDYTAGSGSLRFAAGDTSKTVTVKVTGDQLDESDETLTLTLSNASGADIGDATATGTINDDDSQDIVLSKTAVTVTEASGTGRTADYKVKLATQPTATVTVAVASDATSAATVNKTSLSFTTTNWNTEQTVTVTGVDDSIDNDPDRTATVSHRASGGDYGSVSKDLTVTVTDDEGAASLSVADASVTEGDSGEADLQFTVTLPTAADHEVTVDWATSKETGDTATPGTDYTAGSGSLRFAAGDTSKTVTVTVTGDQLDESNETLTLTLSNASGADISDATATGTINDDDSKDIVLTPAQVTVTEASGTGRTADYKVKLATQPTASVTVTVASDTTSAATVNKASLSFTTTNWNTEQTVTVTGVDDSIDNDPDRTATVSHSASGGDYESVSKDLRVTVTDDDNAVSSSTIALHAAPDSVAESAGATQVTVTAALPGSATRSAATEVTVKVGEKGTAAEGTDYATVADFTVTIAAGQRSGTGNFSIDPIQDATDEGSGETVGITGTTAVSGFAVGETSLTITDDDTRGLVLEPASVMVTEASGSGNTANYAVRLATQPTAAVAVSVSSSETSAATVNKTSLSFSTTNWNQPQTVTVTGVDDVIDNMPNRTATISHSSSGGDYVSVSKDLTVTVIDDEVSASVSIYDTSVIEGDAGTVYLIFRVTLSQAMDKAMTVEWTTEDGSATAGADYNQDHGTLNFAAGDTVETVAVLVRGDQVAESNETLKIKLSVSADRVNIADGEAIGTIIDDDERAQSKWNDLTPWVARFGRTVTDQSLDMISARLKRTTAPGGQVTIAGQRIGQWSGSDGAPQTYDFRGSDSESPYERAHLSSRHATAAARTDTVPNAAADLHHDRPAIRYQRISERVLLTGSSISLAAETDSFGGLSAGLWGQGAIGEFDGRSGKITADGRVSSGFAGIDFTTSEKMMGLAVGYARGKGVYRNPDCEDLRCDGDISASLSGVYPYAGLRLSERLSVWAGAGHAEGNFEFRYVRDGSVLKTDLQYKMAAAGLRGEILASGADDTSAAWKADVRFTRISSDAAFSESDGLKAEEAKVWLARTGIEAAQSHWIGENGVVVTPSAQMSLRLDGGDADAGLGAEAQIGLNIADRNRGLSLNAEVRGLAAHKAKGFRERNARAALAWDPHPSSAQGISMSLEHAWGSSAFTGSVEDSLIWRSHTAKIADRGNNGGRGSVDSDRIRFAMGYGVPVFGNRYIGTPNLGIEMSDDGSRYRRIGWRLTDAKPDESNFLLTFDITSQERMADHDLEYGFLLQVGF